MNISAEKNIPILVAVLIACGGCCSVSLQRSSDWPIVVRSQPAIVAISSLDDTVDCDDEAVYLQEHFSRNRVFLDTVLADRDNPEKYHDADVIISGKILPSVGYPKKSGFGMFACALTLGIYPLCGGPYQTKETSVTYDFNVKYMDTGEEKNYRFNDARKATYGLYKPSAIDKKPGLYEAGWDSLLYEICRELTSIRAGGE